MSMADGALTIQEDQSGMYVLNQHIRAGLTGTSTVHHAGQGFALGRYKYRAGNSRCTNEGGDFESCEWRAIQFPSDRHGDGFETGEQGADDIRHVRGGRDPGRTK